jgi:hypothetical protein
MTVAGVVLKTATRDGIRKSASSRKEVQSAGRFFRQDGPVVAAADSVVEEVPRTVRPNSVRADNSAQFSSVAHVVLSSGHRLLSWMIAKPTTFREEDPYA